MKATEVIKILETCAPEEIEQMLEEGTLRQFDLLNAMAVAASKCGRN